MRHTRSSTQLYVRTNLGLVIVQPGVGRNEEGITWGPSCQAHDQQLGPSDVNIWCGQRLESV